MTAQRSTALDFAGSIEAAAAIITEGTSMFTPEQLAGQYAWDAAEQAGYSMDDEAFIAHLDFLIDAGAKFDAGRALMCAVEFNIESE